MLKVGIEFEMKKNLYMEEIRSFFFSGVNTDFFPKNIQIHF